MKHASLRTGTGSRHFPWPKDERIEEVAVAVAGAFILTSTGLEMTEDAPSVLRAHAIFFVMYNFTTGEQRRIYRASALVMIEHATEAAHAHSPR